MILFVVSMAIQKAIEIRETWKEPPRQVFGQTFTESRLQELEFKSKAAYWDANRKIICQSKMLARTYDSEIKCSDKIFNLISANKGYLDRLKNGSFIMPGGNVIRFIDTKCSQLGVFYLTHPNLNKTEQDKAKFLLAYYKACIIRQIVGHPITDFKKYLEM